MGFSTYDAVVNAITASGGNLETTFFHKALSNGYGTTYLIPSWGKSGIPGAGNYAGTALAAQQVTGSTTGAVKFPALASGKTRHLLGIGFGNGSDGTDTVRGALVVYDRLLYYPGISHTTTSSQTLDNTSTLPRYTDGFGVMAWLEVTTTLGATAQNITLTYTNEGGTTGRTSQATSILTNSNSNQIPLKDGGSNGIFFIPLQAGDKGVRSVQSVAFSAANSAGVSALVLGYVLAILPLPLSSPIYQERDYVVQVPSLPEIKDGAALAFHLLANFGGTSTTGDFRGFLYTSWA